MCSRPGDGTMGVLLFHSVVSSRLILLFSLVFEISGTKTENNRKSTFNM